jgi:hypothetical protein
MQMVNSFLILVKGIFCAEILHKKLIKIFFNFLCVNGDPIGVKIIFNLNRVFLIKINRFTSSVTQFAKILPQTVTYRSPVLKCAVSTRFRTLLKAGMCSSGPLNIRNLNSKLESCDKGRKIYKFFCA